MKRLITAAWFISLFACQAFAGEHSALARVTVYWLGEGSGEHASWTGARLRERHCAVDPKKIPYGSKIVFPDATCVAADTGPAVVRRKAARSCGRTAAERNAIVIDRFFDTKRKALSWAKAHPHFMTVRILTPGTKQGTNFVPTTNPRSSPTNIANSATTCWRGRPNDFYCFNFWMRMHRAPGDNLPIILSAIGIVLIIISGWLGGEMVYVRGVAVRQPPDQSI